MYNPLSMSLKFQQAAMAGASAAAKLMTDNYLRMFKQQHAILEASFPHLRKSDAPCVQDPPVKKKKKAAEEVSPCHGPDLLDHYGKRAHDVDVEHI